MPSYSSGLYVVLLIVMIADAYASYRYLVDNEGEGDSHC